MTVNANGPAITGPITAETIRNMTPMQWTEWEALNGNLDMSTLPDDVVRAIAERGE